MSMDSMSYLTENISGFQMPELKTHFIYKRNPLSSEKTFIDSIEKCLFDYSAMSADEFIKVKDCSNLMTAIFPNVSDKDRYTKSMKVCMLLFILDDHHENDWGNEGHVRQIWLQAIDAMEKVRDPFAQIDMSYWKPYCALLHASVRDICLKLPEVTKIRLINRLKEYCEGNIEENQKILRNGTTFKSIDEYLELKRQVGAVGMGFTLVEYCHNITIGEKEYNDPLFKRWHNLMVDSVLFNNDICSFYKEWISSNKCMEKTPNTVAMMVHLKSLTISEAMNEITEISYEREKEALSLKTELLKRYKSKDFKTYIEEAEFLVGGHNHIQRKMRIRYQVV